MRKRTDTKYNYEKIFQWIVQYCRDNHGHFPSHRELVEYCGISSTSVATYILNRMYEKGWLTAWDDWAGRIRYAVAGSVWMLTSELTEDESDNTVQPG